MAGVLVSMFPFYWTIVMATNTTQDITKYPPKLTFGSHLFDNIQRLLDSIDFFGAMFNTVIVAVSTTALVLLLDSLAAFAFAKYEFPGRRVLFAMLMGIFMLPLQLAIIPQYLIMAELGWLGSLKAVVFPATANAFGIFWMRQYMIGAIHDELIDAARMDGCGFFRQYWHVGLPAVRPGLAFLGIYTFVAAWNDYVWPLVALVNPDRVTLQVALSQLNVSHGRQDYAMVMAGVLLAVLPLVVVFSLFARSFIADATKGAVRE
ncbi:carbohydrate ABC transporter permease [Streptomyces flaveus]|uniref:carbohydrate ABC transporter permease n=1 Tax=Streptomyces flaveus TaxID=66370 RepID=UPI00332190E5